MGRAVVLLVGLAGCRDILGLDSPVLQRDAAAVDAQHSDGVAPDVSPAACSVDAAAVNSMVTVRRNNDKTRLVVSQIDVGGSQMPAVHAGGAFNVTFHYQLTDMACSGSCLDQIEIGFAPGDRSTCLFDSTVSNSTGAQGDIGGPLTAPAQPGRYDIRVNIGQNFSCTSGGATTWYPPAPDDSATIARLCVVP